MKIGILGVGFVGGTHLRAFERAGMGDMLCSHDAKDPMSSIRRVLGASVLFMCLPSPTRDGVQDLSIIRAACAELTRENFMGVVCLKSTVLPGTTTLLENEYGLRICHSPEFLRERTAIEDFEAQGSILVGGHAAERRVVIKAYQEHRKRRGLSPLDVLEYMDPAVTEMAKYMHNTFLATKVAWANEFAAACARLGVPYAEVREAAVAQGVIGGSHLAVPGPDGKPGYSGSCFPKDVRALLDVCPELSILRAAEDANERVRPHDGDCRPHLAAIA